MLSREVSGSSRYSRSRRDRGQQGAGDNRPRSSALFFFKAKIVCMIKELQVCVCLRVGGLSGRCIGRDRAYRRAPGVLDEEKGLERVWRGV
mgnify:CR=1 FL=1